MTVSSLTTYFIVAALCSALTNCYYILKKEANAGGVLVLAPLSLISLILIFAQLGRH